MNISITLPTKKDVVKDYFPVILSLLAIVIFDDFVSEPLSTQRLSIVFPNIDTILLYVQSIFIGISFITLFFKKKRRITHLIIVFILWMATLKLGISVFLIVRQIITSETSSLEAKAGSLFLDALLLWGTNVIIFAIWYWMLDRGGAYNRSHRISRRPDFLFPIQDHCADDWCKEWYDSWQPGFVDYLFLAFTTNTAISPTETMVLSTRAKWLMMLQSSISMTVLVIFVARAINMIK